MQDGAILLHFDQERVDKPADPGLEFGVLFLRGLEIRDRDCIVSGKMDLKGAC
jgi:hypothetical protein